MIHKDKNATAKRSKIIELIVQERKDWFTWLQEHKEQPNLKAIVQNAKKQRSDKDERLQNETEKFRTNIKKAFLGQLDDPTDESWNLWSRNGPSFDDVNHVVRRVQEPYLLAILDLVDKGNSLENWASIGMATANEKTNTMPIINNAENREKRGRKKGKNIDYKRAVWLHCLQDFIWQHTLETQIKHPSYNLKEIIEAYIFACENPQHHEYAHYFQHLEDELKICGKSLDSLYVSFNRGEKKRESMWDD